MIKIRIFAAALAGSLLSTSGAALASASKSEALSGVGRAAASPSSARQGVYTLVAASTLDGLREEADALASYLATMKQGFFGTPKERQKLEQLAHVVAQLQENIAASSTNPDEIAFLSDEAASLRGQFVGFAYPFLKREVKKIVDSIKARQTQVNTSDADLAVLATLAPVGTSLQQRINQFCVTDRCIPGRATLCGTAQSLDDVHEAELVRAVT